MPTRSSSTLELSATLLSIYCRVSSMNHGDLFLINYLYYQLLLHRLSFYVILVYKACYC